MEMDRYKILNFKEESTSEKKYIRITIEKIFTERLGYPSTSVTMFIVIYNKDESKYQIVRPSDGYINIYRHDPFRNKNFSAKELYDMGMKHAEWTPDMVLDTNVDDIMDTLLLSNNYNYFRNRVINEYAKNLQKETEEKIKRFAEATNVDISKIKLVSEPTYKDDKSCDEIKPIKLNNTQILYNSQYFSQWFILYIFYLFNFIYCR